MKTYIRNTYQELEALGFQYDADASEIGKRAYRHPYEPDTLLKLWDGASQSACITILRKANEIAGLSQHGPKMPTTLKERAALARSEQRARRNAEMVLRSLSQMGVDVGKIDLSTQSSAEAKSNEVHIYIR